MNETFFTYFSRSSMSSWLVSVKGTTMRGKKAKNGTLLTVMGKAQKIHDNIVGKTKQ